MKTWPDQFREWWGPFAERKKFHKGATVSMETLIETAIEAFHAGAIAGKKRRHSRNR